MGLQQEYVSDAAKPTVRSSGKGSVIGHKTPRPLKSTDTMHSLVTYGVGQMHVRFTGLVTALLCWQAFRLSHFFLSLLPPPALPPPLSMLVLAQVVATFLALYLRGMSMLVHLARSRLRSFYAPAGWRGALFLHRKTVCGWGGTESRVSLCIAHTLDQRE